jgi:hypothetical protein
MDEAFDGGPAFPHAEIHDDHAGPDGDRRHLLASTGMSKRELFAAILMHSEAVTCGVPGEACEALVQASRAAGTDVIEHMAMNAVQGADALLRALAAPQPPAHRELTLFEKEELRIAEDALTALKDVKRTSAYENLPAALRGQIESVFRAKEDNEIPF